MGSFAGHIDEAIFMILIGVWWMFSSFPSHFKCQTQGDVFYPKLSYPLKTKRRQIPIEFIAKIGFPIIGFLAEIIDNGGSFVDEEGHIRGLNHLMHMSIYGMFTLAGLVDLIGYYGGPVPDGLDRVSLAMTFFWYSLSFTYHVAGPNKDIVEKVVHILPTYAMNVVGVALIVEMLRPSWFIAHVARIFGVLVLGTWFFQTSFVMYSPTPFPGSHPNPAWDREDPRNVMYLVALFGYHLCLHLAVVVIFYIVAAIVVKRSHNAQPRYHKVPIEINEHAENL